MITSEKGKVTLSVSTNPSVAEAEVYADLASIFDAITVEFGFNTLLKYLEFYTSEEIKKYGSRN